MGLSDQRPLLLYKSDKGMPTTSFLLRLVKIVSVAAIGLMAALIVVGNITDYFTNYFFVEHVMKMDTIFPQSHVHYRGIHNATIYHVAYVVIILLETVMSFCCLKGSWQMLRSLKRHGSIFHASKNWAIAGITIGILIWFLGFEVIGGEWFAMWQSTTWNGLAAAERVLAFLGFVVILLNLREE
jgi:predicted small integral membrane protein